MTFMLWLKGVGKALLDFFLPLIRSEAMKLLQDPKTRELLTALVEESVGLSCSGDDKHKATVQAFREHMYRKGQEVALGVAAAAVEAAYQKMKATAGSG